MIKRVKDLNMRELIQLSKEHCQKCNSCSSCVFSGQTNLCNVFSEPYELEENDLNFEVEVEPEDEYVTIYADGEVHMTVEDKDAKIRNQKVEIQNLLTVNNSLRDRIIKLKTVVGGQQKIIEDLVE